MCEGPGILQPREHLESDDDGQTVTPRMQEYFTKSSIWWEFDSAEELGDNVMYIT